MRSLPLAARYKILNSTVTPRPIAWITSLSESGVLNAAPYSFFNAVGDDPPMLVHGLLKHHVHKGLKNTASNIVATHEYVVNLVCEDDAERMVLTSVDAPDEVSEIDYAGIETVPSTAVKPPRIASSPVSFECRLVQVIDFPRQSVVLGEILVTHIKDEFVLDPVKLYLDTPAMKLIGRTHGSGWYVRNSDRMQIDRLDYDPDWMAKGG